MASNYYDLTWDERVSYNKELVDKYPFLLPRNRWTGEVSNDYDYTYTELDSMEKGWRVAFGEKMCEEIAEELKKTNYLDKYRIAQVKEKWGGLRWYDFGAPGEVEEIIDKYARISERTCIDCGAPATIITKGWICPFCDDCAKKRNITTYYWPIDEYFDDFGESNGED